MFLVKDDNNNILTWVKYLSIVKDGALSMLEYSQSPNFTIYQIPDDSKIISGLFIFNN